MAFWTKLYLLQQLIICIAYTTVQKAGESDGAHKTRARWDSLSHYLCCEIVHLEKYEYLNSIHKKQLLTLELCAEMKDSQDYE